LLIPLQASRLMTIMVYKILRPFELKEMQDSGVFPGSADDKRDGFIHFSSASQVNTTYSKYFGQEDRVWLVAVDANRLDPALKWEVSRGGERFPHLYGPLLLSSVESVTEIRRGADGRPMFPPEIP
jgi:uncharacterized protein (DUF952 family)